MLALSFLMLIGMTLIADGAGFHVPKGYIYAAIGFSIGVEALNQFAARRRNCAPICRSAEPWRRSQAWPLKWISHNPSDPLPLGPEPVSGRASQTRAGLVPSLPPVIA